MIRFGPYLPDLPAFENPGVTRAINVLPSATAYLPWPSQSVYSNALDSRCRGAISARDKDGNVYLYAGDSAKLYSLADDTFSDASKTGSPAYALADDENWEFATWNQKVIGVCGVNQAATNNMQAITFGASNFADVSGAPQARHIAVIRDFVVVGNTWDASDGLVPNRVRWSAKGDETDWTIAASTQADKEDLAGGGWVQRITGGEYGLIFADNAVWRMSYIGSPIVFQFDEILPGRGTPAPGSVAQIGDNVFFLSQEGFEVIVNGSTSQPIGAHRINRTFFSEFDASAADRITSVADPVSNRVFWAYPGSGNRDGEPNKVLCYDYAADKWTYSDQYVQQLFVANTPGYTMDGLDSVNSNLDLLGPSLDSRVWMGGAPKIGVFDDANKLSWWSGSNMSAIIETAEFEATPGRRSLLSAVRPLVDGGSTTVQIGHRNRQQDSLTWMSAASTNSSGLATMRKNARYHRVRLNISGGFTKAIGADVQARGWGFR